MAAAASHLASRAISSLSNGMQSVEYDPILGLRSRNIHWWSRWSWRGARP